MTCIVIFLALLIERFFDWSHLRNWRWFYHYQWLVTEHLLSLNAYLSLMIISAPILLLILLAQFLVDDWLYGFIKLIFELAILLYTLGPKNLWADPFFSNNALTLDPARVYPTEMTERGTSISESSLAKNISNEAQIAECAHASELNNGAMIDSSYSKSLHWHVLNNIFIAANARLFAVIFWFLILGPVGACLYRLIGLLSPGAQTTTSEYDIAHAAQTVQAILDWFPIRLLTFLFALSGHFVQVLETWRKYFSFGLNNNETMLTECGIAALGLQDQDKDKIPEDGSAERHAAGLIDRVFIFLIVVALIGIFLS